MKIGRRNVRLRRHRCREDEKILEDDCAWYKLIRNYYTRPSRGKIRTKDVNLNEQSYTVMHASEAEKFDQTTPTIKHIPHRSFLLFVIEIAR